MGSWAGPNPPRRSVWRREGEHRVSSPRRLLLAVSLGVMLLVSAAAAAPSVTDYRGSIRPDEIAAGPDGNLWFTESDVNRIGKITPAGVITEYSAGISPSSGPFGITAGPDGNLWFTEINGRRIGKITPAGVVSEYSAGISPDSVPWVIAAGPDGNLWFTESQRIGK